MKKAVIFVCNLVSFFVIYGQVDDKKVEEDIHNEVFNLGLHDLVNMEITVASKKAEKVSDAPAMITVYGKQDIEHYGYYTLSDLAGITSGYGMAPVAYAEKGFETRGQANSAFENDKHLVLIDGIPVNFARSYKAPIDYELPIFFTKRIEFLKGPASALYGVSAFYGVVNMISDDLEDNGIQVNAKMSLGSLDFTHRMMANTIIKNDAGQIKLSFGYYSKDASHAFAYKYQNGIFDPNTSFKNWDAQQSFFMNFSHQLTDGRLNGLSFGTIYMNRKTNLGVSWDSQQSSPINEQNWITFVPYLKYDKQLSSKFSIHSYGKLNASDEKGTFLNFSKKDSTHNEIASDFLRRTQSVEFLLETKYKASKNLNFIAGLNFDTRGKVGKTASYDNFLYSNDIDSNRLIQQFSDYQEIKTNIKTLSSYLQSQYQLNFLKGLILTAGFRYDYGIISKEEHYEQLSPRLGLVQKLTDKVSVKLLYGKALRSPTPKAIGINQEAKKTVQDQKFPLIIHDVKAETIESFEAGISFNHRKIGTSIAVFSNLTKNSLEKQQDNFDTGNVNYYKNLGQTQAHGMEFDFYYVPIQNIKLIANYSFAETLKKSINFMPNHKVNAAINYTLSGKYKMSFTVINRNVLQIRGDENINKNPYSLLDLNVIFPLSKQISIETQVRNVLNTECYTPTNNMYIQQPLRNFLFTLSLQY